MGSVTVTDVERDTNKSSSISDLLCCMHFTPTLLRKTQIYPPSYGFFHYLFQEVITIYK